MRLLISCAEATLFDGGKPRELGQVDGVIIQDVGGRLLAQVSGSDEYRLTVEAVVAARKTDGKYVVVRVDYKRAGMLDG